MVKTVYLKGRHAPGGQDWIHAYQTKHDQNGIWVYTSTRHDIKPIFFPWSSVERVG